MIINKLTNEVIFNNLTCISQKSKGNYIQTCKVPKEFIPELKSLYSAGLKTAANTMKLLNEGIPTI